MESRDISKAVIRRLPRYYRYLQNLKEDGVKRISSKDLSRIMRITASQVRQDLNCFGGFGQQGYGYNVESLYLEIAGILGIDQEYTAIVIGAGNIGKSVVQYKNFSKRGFNIIAIFDSDREMAGMEVGHLKVTDINELENFIKSEKVDIAILAVPRDVTREVAETVVGLGIKGIWNFSPMGLLVSDESVIVENVHLSDSLMVLGYKLRNSLKALDEQ